MLRWKQKEAAGILHAGFGDGGRGQEPMNAAGELEEAPIAFPGTRERKHSASTSILAQ